MNPGGKHLNLYPSGNTATSKSTRVISRTSSSGSSKQNGTSKRKTVGDGLNSSLVTYMKQQGLVHSAQALIDELATPVTATAKKRKNQNIQLDTFSDGYEQLRTWLIDSLDQFRDELWPVLWVVYFHSYFSLIESADMEGAVIFRSRFKHDHEPNHFDDLAALGAISNPAQLKDSEFAQRLLRAKFQLSICDYACDLLLTFLVEHELFFIVSIVNERIDITKEETPSRISCLGQKITGVLEMDVGSTASTGLEDSQLSRLKTRPVKWYVPKLFNALIGGATGAKALSELHPKVPEEYLSGMAGDANQKKDEMDDLNDEEIKKLQKGNRLNKINRDSVDQRKRTEDSSKSKLKSKAKIRGNHIAPKEAHPDLDQNYYRDMQKYLLQPLDLEKVDAQTIYDSTLCEETQTYTEEIVSSVGLPVNGAVSSAPSKEWPSIALQTFFNTHNSLICVDMSLDSKVFVAGFDDSVVRVWYYPEKSKSVEKTSTEPIGEDLHGHSGPVYACSLAMDKTNLLTCSEDGSIRLWKCFPELLEEALDDTGAGAGGADDHQSNDMEVDDLDTKKKKMKKKKKTHHKKRAKPSSWRNVFAFRPRPSCPVWDVRFSPAGYYFVSGGYDGVVRLWCIERPHPLRIFHGHLADVNCLAWHPNCHYVASGSTDKTIRVWDVIATSGGGGSCVRLFCGHIAGINTIAFTSSGRYLISGGEDRLLFVWDFASGERTFVLEGHTGPVYSCSISQNMDFITTGSADGAVRVWETHYIWGKGSLAHYMATTDEAVLNKKKVHHYPKEVTTKPECRSFPTKFTPINFVRFNNERLIVSSGAFALQTFQE